MLYLTKVQPGFYRALNGRVEIHKEVQTLTRTRAGKTVGYKEISWFAIVDSKRRIMNWPTRNEAIYDAERALNLTHH